LNSSQKSFFKIAESSFRFRLFLLVKLPAAFFSGVKIIYIDEHKCITSVPYKWLTQNPFRSIYFASLAMAAEMSTGALALSNIYKREPAVSMLVVKMEAEYYKKATGTIRFTCEQGVEMSAAVGRSGKTGESVGLVAKSTGKNKAGEVVALFTFYWSFKVKAGHIKL
jgi:Domain of unknown function (DUF4442)